MEMITFTTVLMGGLTPNKDGNGDRLFYGVNNNNNNEMKEIILRDRISN